MENRDDQSNKNNDGRNWNAITRHQMDIAFERIVPFVELIDKHDCIVIVVELHGYNSREIQLNTDGSVLNIHADALGRTWNKGITFPVAIDPKNSEATYNNGILEVTLKKGYCGSEGFVLIELI